MSRDRLARQIRSSREDGHHYEGEESQRGGLPASHNHLEFFGLACKSVWKRRFVEDQNPLHHQRSIGSPCSFL